MALRLRPLIALGLLAASAVFAVEKKAPEEGSIAIIGCLKMRAGNVTAMRLGEQVLYLEDWSRGLITVVDVARPAAPRVSRQVEFPEKLGGSGVEVIAGESALLAAGPAVSAAPGRGTFLLVSSVGSPAPKVQHRFENVIELRQDPGRGLIYILDGEGLWVLEHRPAVDREVQREFERNLLYNR